MLPVVDNLERALAANLAAAEEGPLREGLVMIHPFDDPDVIAATTNYGVEFVSGIQRKNIYAFQFHPEKSQKLGLAVLEKFAQLN